MMSQDTEEAAMSSPGPEHIARHKRKKDEKNEKKERKERKKRKRDAAEHHSKPEDSPVKGMNPYAEDTIATTGADHHQDTPSPFCYTTASQYLPISPISHLHPLNGICAEHLSPLILTYYPPLKGVVLSYKNVKLSEDPEDAIIQHGSSKVLAKSIDEFAVSFIWVTVDFLLFKPQRGEYIEGWINLQNESHIGLVCWNLFNASVDRKRLPSEWKWQGTDLGTRSTKKMRQLNGASSAGTQEHQPQNTESNSQEYEGYFEDSEGNKLEGQLRFRIKDIETSHSTDKESAFVSIEGTLLSEEEENELLEKEATRTLGGGRGVRNRHGGPNDTATGSIMSGSQPNEEEDRPNQGSATAKKKHKVKY